MTTRMWLLRCACGIRRTSACAAAATLLAMGGAPLSARFPADTPAIAVSSREPTLFQFHADPQALCFLPGNLGAHLFGGRQEPPFTEFLAADELRCEGQVVVLDDPGYRLHPFSDGMTSGSQSWWTALEEAFRIGAQSRRLTDLRVTGLLLDQLGSPDGARAQAFVEQLQVLCAGAGTVPTVSFDVSPRHEFSASGLRDLLRREIAGLLAGRLVRELPLSPGGLNGWDYAIVSPALLPENVQGQAAVGALHATLGPVPLVLLLDGPELYRDLTHLVTGAAGFQYVGMKLGPGHPVRSTQYRQLRAFVALKGRLNGEGLRPMPELAGGAVLAAFGRPGEIYCLLLAQGGSGRFPLPAVSGRPDSIGSWYRPATDETIMLPRLSGDAAPKQLELKPPTENAAWIYCHETLPPLAPEETTTPVVIIPTPTPRPSATPSFFLR